MFERFTPAARQSVVRAQTEAQGRGDLMIEGHHLLLGLLDSLEPELAAVLGTLGVDAAAARRALADHMGSGLTHGDDKQPLEMDDDIRWAIETSLVMALSMGDTHIGTEHILLALTYEPHGEVLELILAQGTTPGRISEAIATHLGKPVPTRRSTYGSPVWRRVNEKRRRTSRRRRP